MNYSIKKIEVHALERMGKSNCIQIQATDSNPNCYTKSWIGANKESILSKTCIVKFKISQCIS